MIWFAASTRASLADGWTATKSNPCDEIVSDPAAASRRELAIEGGTSTPSRSPKNFAVSIPCETQVEAAPISEVAAVYFFSGRSSGSSPSEARPCAAVTWRPTPVAMARAPSVANVPLNASRRLKPFFKRSPTNSSSSPASGPRFATSPIDATSTWTDHRPCRRPPPATRCTASPRHRPGSRFRHGLGNFGPKGMSGLNSRQTSRGPPPGNTSTDSFSPRRHGGLPHFSRSLVACAGRYHMV